MAVVGSSSWRMDGMDINCTWVMTRYMGQGSGSGNTPQELQDHSEAVPTNIDIVLRIVILLVVGRVVAQETKGPEI